jgi:hypothetical protein
LSVLGPNYERRVPVTAKLSSKFYERFGDEIAGELVDWFNAVDLTYQTQLKETNELNWERFKATLQAEAAAIRTEVAKTDAGLRNEMVKMDEGLRREMKAMQADLHKWMFVYWSSLMVPLVGLIVGMQVFHGR